MGRRKKQESFGQDGGAFPAKFNVRPMRYRGYPEASAHRQRDDNVELLEARRILRGAEAKVWRVQPCALLGPACLARVERVDLQGRGIHARKAEARHDVRLHPPCRLLRPEVWQG